MIKQQLSNMVCEVAAARALVDSARKSILAGGNAPTLADLIAALPAAVEARARPHMRRVINATGVVLHTNLGRAPLPRAAIEALLAASGACNLELDLETGQRGSRQAGVSPLIARLFGAQAGTAVNNCAAATVITLRALCRGKEVLIRRRPDLREAERKVAAQSARIGVATSELLPALSLNGTVGVYYNTLGNFASTGSLTGSIGPSFQWNVLNYGRLLAKVRYEDAQFTGAVAALENRVLEAQREVEDGIVRYLKSSEIVDELTKGAVAARRAMELGVTQYRENTQNYLWVYNLERALAGILEQLIQARGQQLQALVETYRALGGGWNLRPEGDEPLPEGNLPQPRPERIESLPLPAVKSSD